MNPLCARANYRIEPAFFCALEGRQRPEGRTDGALAAPRDAVDQHWHGDPLWLDRDPKLESLASALQVAGGVS